MKASRATVLVFRNALWQIKAGEWTDGDSWDLAGTSTGARKLIPALLRGWGFIRECTCFLSSPLWHHSSNGQAASIFINTGISFPPFTFTFFLLDSRPERPLVILHILYLLISSKWNNQPFSELQESCAGRSGGDLKSPYKKGRGFHFSDIHLVRSHLERSLFVFTTDHPLDFLSIYSIVTIAVYNHGHKTKPDYANFKSLRSHGHSNATCCFLWWNRSWKARFLITY